MSWAMIKALWWTYLLQLTAAGLLLLTADAIAQISLILGLAVLVAGGLCWLALSLHLDDYREMVVDRIIEDAKRQTDA